jgi:hypothetical protein
MKKVLTLLVLCVFSLAIKTNARTITTTSTEPGSFSAGIFGCWGNGYCTRTSTIETNAMSTMTTSGNGGTIIIAWDFKTLNAKNQEFYQGADVFKSDADALIPEDVCQGLGLPIGSKFLRGSYPIVWKGNSMIVEVNIKQG